VGAAPSQSPSLEWKQSLSHTEGGDGGDGGDGGEGLDGFECTCGAPRYCKCQRYLNASKLERKRFNARRSMAKIRRNRVCTGGLELLQT